MNPALKARILRVADQVKVVNHYRELVEAMAKISDEWNSSSSLMQKAMETRDVGLLSKAILENNKQAKSMNYIMERHERIAAKLGEQS